MTKKKSSAQCSAAGKALAFANDRGDHGLLGIYLFASGTITSSLSTGPVILTGPTSRIGMGHSVTLLGDFGSRARFDLNPSLDVRRKFGDFGDHGGLALRQLDFVTTLP